MVSGVIQLGGLSPSALAAQPPAEVVEELEREVTPTTDARCPDPLLYSVVRPDPAGGPTVVGIVTFFQDLAALNDADQTLDIDMYLIMRWRDPRLANSVGGVSSAECPVPVGRLWMPQLEPERLRSRQAFYPDRFLVDPRGVVTFVRRLWVKVAYPLDFRDFPFDRHAWTITLCPAVSGREEIVFHPMRRGTGISERLSLQGWPAMLTLIAYMLTLGSTLPKISYLTRADRFFVGSALLVFIGLMKAVATLALAQGPRGPLH